MASKNGQCISSAPNGERLPTNTSHENLATPLRDARSDESNEVSNDTNNSVDFVYSQNIVQKFALAEKEPNVPRGDLFETEESAQARLERLGRQRPEAFDSLWAEIGFVFSISMSQVLTVSLHLCFFQNHPDFNRSTSFQGLL